MVARARAVVVMAVAARAVGVVARARAVVVMVVMAVAARAERAERADLVAEEPAAQ